MLLYFFVFCFVLGGGKFLFCFCGSDVWHQEKSRRGPVSFWTAIYTYYIIQAAGARFSVPLTTTEKIILRSTALEQKMAGGNDHKRGYNNNK